MGRALPGFAGYRSENLGTSAARDLKPCGERESGEHSTEQEVRGVGHICRQKGLFYWICARYELRSVTLMVVEYYPEYRDREYRTQSNKLYLSSADNASSATWIMSYTLVLCWPSNTLLTSKLKSSVCNLP